MKLSWSLSIWNLNAVWRLWRVATLANIGAMRWPVAPSVIINWVFGVRKLTSEFVYSKNPIFGFKVSFRAGALSHYRFISATKTSPNALSGAVFIFTFFVYIPVFVISLFFPFRMYICVFISRRLMLMLIDINTKMSNPWDAAESWVTTLFRD